MRHPARRPSPRSGLAALELALVAPVLVLVVGGILEFGWMFYQRTTIQGAVRQGCRVAALARDVPDREQAAEEAMASVLRARHFACQTADCGAEALVGGTEEDPVLVCRVRVPYRSISGLVNQSDGIHLQATTRLHVEWKD